MFKQAKSPIANWKQIESNGFILSNRPKENKIDILFQMEENIGRTNITIFPPTRLKLLMLQREAKFVDQR